MAACLWAPVTVVPLVLGSGLLGLSVGVLVVARLLSAAFRAVLGQVGGRAGRVGAVLGAWLAVGFPVPARSARGQVCAGLLVSSRCCSPVSWRGVPSGQPAARSPRPCPSGDAWGSSCYRKG